MTASDSDSGKLVVPEFSETDLFLLPHILLEYGGRHCLATDQVGAKAGMYKTNLLFSME